MELWSIRTIRSGDIGTSVLNLYFFKHVMGSSVMLVWALCRVQSTIYHRHMMAKYLHYLHTSIYLRIYTYLHKYLRIYTGHGRRGWGLGSSEVPVCPVLSSVLALARRRLHPAPVAPQPPDQHQWPECYVIHRMFRHSAHWQ